MFILILCIKIKNKKIYKYFGTIICDRLHGSMRLYTDKL